MGLARDRLNGLLASPSATSVAHLRALALLAWIVTDNATWVMLHFAAFPSSDITYRLLWLFDAVVISIEALQTATIYGEPPSHLPVVKTCSHACLPACVLVTHVLPLPAHQLLAHVTFASEIAWLGHIIQLGTCLLTAHKEPVMRLAGVQMLDRWRMQRAVLKQGAAGAHPWEGKGGLLYHIDLGLDLVIRVTVSAPAADRLLY